MVRRFANTVATTCPSTAYQVELDLRVSGELASTANRRQKNTGPLEIETTRLDLRALTRRDHAVWAWRSVN